jgi:hypothetical protein
LLLLLVTLVVTCCVIQTAKVNKQKRTTWNFCDCDTPNFVNV